jgi:hypothetical protein
MKKQAKKLVLAKETIGSLVDQELRTAWGGSTEGLFTCKNELCYQEFSVTC